MPPRSSRLHHRNLPLLLMQARERVIAHFRPILNAHGITEQQWRIVRVLLDVPALEPRQIGELCAISSPSMAGVLERMDLAGYITRRRVEHDQRRVMVALTARSRQLAASMAPEIDRTYQLIESRLGAPFSRRLYEALDLLCEQLPAPGTDEAVAGERDDRSAGRTIAEPVPAVARRRRARRN